MVDIQATNRASYSPKPGDRLLLPAPIGKQHSNGMAVATSIFADNRASFAYDGGYFYADTPVLKFDGIVGDRFAYVLPVETVTEQHQETVRLLNPPLGCNIGAGAADDAKTYFYPTDRELTFAKEWGMRDLRWPFRLKRVFDRQGNPHPDVKAKGLIDALDMALGMGFTVTLDPHEYGVSVADGTTSILLTPAEAPLILKGYNAVFAKYKGDDRVTLSFVNEPHKLGEDWWASAAALLRAFRADGWTNPIALATSGYSPLTSAKSKIPQMLAIKDPLGKLLWEFHQYFDGSGGTTGAKMMGLAATAAEADVQAWIDTNLEPHAQALRAAGIKAFLGEYGFGSNALGLLGARVFQRWIQANADVFVRATWFLLSGIMPHPKMYYGLTSTYTFAPSPALMQLKTLASG